MMAWVRGGCAYCVCTPRANAASSSLAPRGPALPCRAPCPLQAAPKIFANLK